MESGKPQKSWGIFTTAAIMAVFHVLAKSTLYTIYWGYLAYLAYINDIKRIHGLVKVVLIVNVFLLLVLVASSPEARYRIFGYESAGLQFVSVGLPILVNFILFMSVKNRLERERRLALDGLPVDESSGKASLSEPKVDSLALEDVADDALAKRTPNDGLYVGANNSIEKKINNLLLFSKKADRIQNLLLCESDIVARSRFIEEFLKDNHDDFVEALEGNIRTRLNSISIKDQAVRARVIEILKQLIDVAPVRFGDAYSVAVDLGDGLDIEIFSKTFEVSEKLLPPESRAAAPVQVAPRDTFIDKKLTLSVAEVIEQISDGSISGEDIALVLTSAGFPTQLKEVSGATSYLMTYEDSELHFNYLELLEFCREEPILNRIKGIAVKFSPL